MPPRLTPRSAGSFHGEGGVGSHQRHPHIWCACPPWRTLPASLNPGKANPFRRG
jgi:hypothetical protein